MNHLVKTRKKKKKKNKSLREIPLQNPCLETQKNQRQK